MLDLRLFTENGYELKILEKDGRLLFDATSVCKSLEYAKDAATVILKLEDYEKELLSRDISPLHRNGGVGKCPVQVVCNRGWPLHPCND